jgi:HD-GYP domain-containing protein (c-di-GMP phosphodiesterase class II)
MSKTILIHDNEELKKLYAINLKTYSATDIVERKNAEDAVALLSILPTIDLIIAKNNIGDENTGVEIYNYLKENNLEIPLIVLGECEEISTETLCLTSPTEWEILIEHASRLLGITEEEVKKKIIPNHVPIESKYFYEIDHTPCDIFIRIKKGLSEFEYIKRLHAQDSFEASDIEKYEAQGLSLFYIPKDYQQYFVNFVTTNIIQKLERHDIGIQDRLNATSNGFELVRDHIQEIGINESIQELAQSGIKSMITAVQESHKLSSLLKMLLSTKISYAYQHAHLICVIGDFILSKQNWYEQKHLNIFASAAFFSDITLKTVEQIRANSEDDLTNSSLSEQEKQEVRTHAADAAELMVGTPLYSDYLYTVIQHHQGSLDGKGIPDDPSEETHPIAKVFVIADYFVKLMLDPNAPKNKKEILAIIYARFESESYQKIIKTLELKIS